MNNKKVTKTGIFLLVMLEFLFFGLVWYLDYIDKMFFTYKTHGYYSCVLIWLVIYLSLCSLYRAFSFASTPVGETVFSQFISFGIADLVMYIICVLIRRDFVSLWPGLICVVGQLIAATFIVIIIKRILMKIMIPYKTLVLYGSSYSETTAKLFVERLLKKYSHMFVITEIVFDDEDDVKINKLLDENEKVILLGVSYEHRKTIVKTLIDEKKVFYFVPEIEEIIFMNCETKNLLDTPLKRYNYDNERFSYIFTKRVIDILLSAVLLILLSPLILIAAIAIKIEDHGPVMFKQKRITKGEKEFTIYKFRSMVVDADDTEKYGVRPTTNDDSRITRVGKVIRGMRIDELPQLINILKGDMSFVGPRPERIEHVQKYEADLPEFKYRHLVRGGLTGYAQVYGKYNTTPEDKLKLDLLYIMNSSLLMDAKLFLLTIKTVFQKESTDGFGSKQAKEMNKGI